MKQITQNFKDNIKLLGRELDSIITYEDNGETIELTNENLIRVSPHYEGGILKSVMKCLDIESNIDIPLETVINYQFGVKVRDEEVEDYRDNYEYINFGNYIVYKSEKQEDTNSYKLTCYDKMLYSMKDYVNLNLTYPITIKNYINAICNYMGLTFANASDTFVNYNKEIPSELYLDSNNNSLGYTFRDILDELAEVTASTICINSNDELEIRYPKSTASSEIVNLDYITGSNGISITETQSSNHFITVKFKFKKVGNCYIIYTDKGKLSYSNGVLYLIYYNTLIGSVNYTFLENTDYTVEVSHNTNSSSVYINNTKVISNLSSYTTYSDQKIFFYNSSDIIVDVYSIKIGGSSADKYIPAFNSTTNKTGMYNSYTNDFVYANGYTGNHFSANDTIDEEYLKDINVNFGKKYGPINTVILSRANGADKISMSLPENLSDDLKIAIEISDNEIMNFNNRDEFGNNILSKLYGLEYYINDFTSTGIIYYDLCDEYNVQIKGNTYNCIMLNDEIKVSNGLEEYIYADEIKESVKDYKNISETDRGITQANINASKAEGKVEAIVQSIGQNGEVTGASLILAINNDTSQAKIDADNVDINANDVLNILAGNTINLTSNTIAINSTNFSVNSSGDMTCNNATINGTISKTSHGQYQDTTITLGDPNNTGNALEISGTGGFKSYMNPGNFITYDNNNISTIVGYGYTMQTNNPYGEAIFKADGYYDTTTVKKLVAGNIDCGNEWITPIANTPTSKHVDFNKTFSTPPIVVATPESAVIGSTVKGVSVANITTTGFDIYIYRTNTTSTNVHWIAML